MHQHVAAVAGVSHGVAGARVAGDHDRPIAGLKTVAVRVRPFAMRHLERGHRDEVVVIDDARGHVMADGAVSRLVRRLASVQANIDVLGVRGLEMLDHRTRPRRTVDVQRSGSAEHPGREHQIG